jgi:cell division septum initiation protein DivIVA
MSEETKLETPATETPGESLEPSEPLEEKPAPGTPDKALQKLQQDLAAQQRKIDSLLTKAEEGTGLTPSERKEVVKAQRKIDAVREAMKTGFDIVDRGDDLAAGLVETDDEVQTLKTRLDKLEKEKEQQSASSTWNQVKTDYQGVDVDAVWKKAVADAVETIGDIPGATHKLASRFFHDRAKAASQSVAAKTGKQPTGKATVNPGGARVTMDGGRAPAQSETPEARYRKNALSLVQDDE